MSRSQTVRIVQDNTDTELRIAAIRASLAGVTENINKQSGDWRRSVAWLADIACYLEQRDVVEFRAAVHGQVRALGDLLGVLRSIEGV